jgi:hypothetical protein
VTNDENTLVLCGKYYCFHHACFIPSLHLLLAVNKKHSCGGKNENAIITPRTLFLRYILPGR